MTFNSALTVYSITEDPVRRSPIQGIAFNLNLTSTDFVIFTPDSDKNVLVKGLMGAETNGNTISWKQRSANLNGTVAITSGSATITGTGTSFLSQFATAITDGTILNTQIVVDGAGTPQLFSISSVNSNTSITATANASVNASGKTIQRQDILVTPEYAANQGIYSKVMEHCWDFATAVGYSLVANASAAISSLLIHVQEGAGN